MLVVDLDIFLDHLQVHKSFRVGERARELDFSQDITVAVDGRVTRRDHRSILVQSGCQLGDRKESRSGGA